MKGKDILWSTSGPGLLHLCTVCAFIALARVVRILADDWHADPDLLGVVRTRCVRNGCQSGTPCWAGGAPASRKSRPLDLFARGHTLFPKKASRGDNEVRRLCVSLVAHCVGFASPCYTDTRRSMVIIPHRHVTTAELFTCWEPCPNCPKCGLFVTFRVKDWSPGNHTSRNCTLECRNVCLNVTSVTSVTTIHHVQPQQSKIPLHHARYLQAFDSSTRACSEILHA
jgi:hypothetical protein